MAPPARDDDRMEAWKAFLTAHAAVTETLDRELEAGRGLPLTWYDVLIQLQERGGRARMQELARSILFSNSGLTPHVQSMEKAGHLRREACTQDARGTYAVITPAGRRMLTRARPLHHRGIEEHFSRHLTDAEARAVRSAFEKVARAQAVE